MVSAATTALTPAGRATDRAADRMDRSLRLCAVIAVLLARGAVAAADTVHSSSRHSRALKVTPLPVPAPFGELSRRIAQINCFCTISHSVIGSCVAEGCSQLIRCSRSAQYRTCKFLGGMLCLRRRFGTGFWAVTTRFSTIVSLYPCDLCGKALPLSSASYEV